MNLAAIADLVTKRVGMVGANDVLACKTFLTQRHDQLYRSKLFKDSIIEYVLPIDPTVLYQPNSPFLPTKGVLVLPPIFAHVLAARTSEHKLDIQRPMLFYRIDQDEFVKTGEPLDYFLMPAVAWDFDTAQNLTLQGTQGGDVGQAVNLTTLSAADSVSELINQYLLQNTYLAAGETGTIQKLNKPATQNQVVLGVWYTLNTAALTYINNGGSTQVVVPVTQGQIYQIIAQGNELNGQMFNGNQVVNLFNSNPIVITAQGSTLLFNAPVGDQVIYLGPPPFPFQSTVQLWEPILTLNPADTDAPQRQRVRFLDIPTAATTVRVLGKRTTPAFVADTDTPGVNGMEGPLIGMAYYDMLLRDERGGTKEATDALEEAGGLLKQLEGEEVYQGASNTRILPESGLGPDEYYIGPIF